MTEIVIDVCWHTSIYKNTIFFAFLEAVIKRT
jgi:hypothetical protein